MGATPKKQLSPKGNKSPKMRQTVGSYISEDSTGSFLYKNELLYNLKSILAPHKLDKAIEYEKIDKISNHKFIKELPQLVFQKTIIKKTHH